MAEKRTCRAPNGPGYGMDLCLFGENDGSFWPPPLTPLGVSPQRARTPRGRRPESTRRESLKELP